MATAQTKSQPQPHSSIVDEACELRSCLQLHLFVTAQADYIFILSCFIGLMGSFFSMSSASLSSVFFSLLDLLEIS